MSQSLANIVVHLVFSTKGRRQLLRDEERDQLHAYITGILRKQVSPLIEISSPFRPRLGLRAARFTPGFHIAGLRPLISAVDTLRRVLSSLASFAPEQV